VPIPTGRQRLKNTPKAAFDIQRFIERRNHNGEADALTINNLSIDWKGRNRWIELWGLLKHAL
jgi:hypothetical protein